jgi:hypothetical protein
MDFASVVFAAARLARRPLRRVFRREYPQVDRLILFP